MSKSWTDGTGMVLSPFYAASSGAIMFKCAAMNFPSLKTCESGSVRGWTSDRGAGNHSAGTAGWQMPLEDLAQAAFSSGRDGTSTAVDRRRRTVALSRRRPKRPFVWRLAPFRTLQPSHDTNQIGRTFAAAC